MNQVSVSGPVLIKIDAQIRPLYCQHTNVPWFDSVYYILWHSYSKDFFCCIILYNIVCNERYLLIFITLFPFITGLAAVLFGLSDCGKTSVDRLSNGMPLLKCHDSGMSGFALGWLDGPVWALGADYTVMRRSSTDWVANLRLEVLECSGNAPV